MKKIVTHVILLLFLLPAASWAQQAAEGVHLRHSVYYPLPNSEEFVRSSPSPLEVVNGKYFRLIQFHELPSGEQKNALAALGVDLLQYYPYRTWLASIPVDVNRTQLANQARSIFPLPASEKLHQQLFQENYPDHAWAGTDLQLIVQVPENLNPSFLAGLLQKAGFATGDVLRDGQQIELQCPPSMISVLASLPYVTWIEAIPDPGEPEDLRALALHRSNSLASDHPMGRHYNGDGIKVLVRDDGGIGPHIDFEGRTNQNATGGPGGGTHGDMVAGVFGGAGNLDPTTRGAAWGSFFYLTNYQSAFTDITLSLHQVDSVMITNSSYSNGCNNGYTTITQRVDQQAFFNPGLMHMFSAGNSNNTDCGYGAGTQWGNITGGHKQGKNVIAVANLLPDGTLVNSSSRGPAHDGRIKPDVSANGNEQMSTDPFNAYLPGGGTSAAAPSTAGVIAQLYQAYRELGNGSYPPSALIKAVVLNTAEDYGNRGPDFKFGWGRINGLRAVKTLEEERYFSASIASGTNLHSIEVPPGVTTLKVMTYWMDPAASPGVSIALVNDLDTRIIGPSGEFFPWVLNPSPNAITLNVPATKGQDHLNNMEQIQIDQPMAGTYNLVVTGFSVPQGPQTYFVVYEFITEAIEVTHPIGGEGFAPGEQVRIHWDADGNFGPFSIHYRASDQDDWSLVTAGISGNQRFHDWVAPKEITGKARVRVSRGNVSAESPHEFAIIGIPSGLEVKHVCNTKMTLVWDEVPGAIGYDVFQLGTQFMDSVGTTNERFYTFDILTPFIENWVSVRAITADDRPGRRAVAVSNVAGIPNCTAGNDLQVSAIPSLGDGSFPACADTIGITLEILNSGSTPQSNFTVGYRVSGLAPVQVTIPDLLQPNQVMYYTFPVGFAPVFNMASSVEIKGFVGIAGDVKPSNDTLVKVLEFSNTPMLNAPFVQNMEGFSFCSTASNCENATCLLTGGWINEPNGIRDDINWRVNAGSTPTINTGPISDHNPGTVTGKYLYLESSNNCNRAEAVLSSPCVFIEALQKPTISVWYHMFGVNMGELHIDIFDGSSWQKSVGKVAGDQGPQWKELTVDLSHISSSLIAFRVRGITGTGFYSDLAIDNIAVYDAATPPVADFSISRQALCIGDEASLIDLSSASPENYEWKISPAQASFLAGSSAQSASPLVSFGQVGTYDVTLTVSNAYGADSVTKTLFVTASHGQVPPIVEDFESGIFPPAGWGLDNPDGDITWGPTSVIGASSALTNATIINNFQYANVGAEDLLHSFPVDLRTAIAPQLSFDLAYAPRNSLRYDELRVVISDNCGQSYLYPIFQQAQSDLQTTGLQNTSFLPSSANQWRRESLDLTSFVGQTIGVGFVNLNGTGNNLFLDNISILDTVTVAPQAVAEATLQTLCVGEWTTFSDASTGNNLQYNWNLGDGAAPGSMGFSGSFQASYSTPGLKTVILTVSNLGGSSSDTLTILVKDTPTAAFTFGISGGFQSFAFDNLSTSASTFVWSFGDGNTSSDSLPVHTYLQNGTYPVMLIATSECGSDTTTSDITITNVSIDGWIGDLRVKAFPNPADDVLNIEVQGNQRRLLHIELSDLQGKMLLSQDWEIEAGSSDRQIQVAEWPAGVYLLQLRHEQGRLVRRIVLK